MAASFGGKLRALRISRGFTLEQLGEIAGTTKTYIWQLENKPNADPTASLALRLATALAVPPEYLLDDAVQDAEFAEQASVFYRKFNKLSAQDRDVLSSMIDTLSERKSRERRRPPAEANRITKLWQEFGPGTYPIDFSSAIPEIINRSNEAQLEVESRPLDSVEGALVNSAPGRWKAAISNKIRNRGRRNFTLAHEIGHFVCHRDRQTRFLDNADTLNDFGNQTEIENEANVFASHLLLPANLVREVVDDQIFSFEIVNMLAQKFDSSLSAAAFKAMEITNRKSAVVLSRDGLLSWGRASEKAFKGGLFFRNTAVVPEQTRTARAGRTKNGERPTLMQGGWTKEPYYESFHLSERTGFILTCLELV